MIRKLPPHIVNQIAAGEVIERPASVVKECLENALDAGATEVKVSYEEGGLSYLGIEDNGSGIDEDDLPLLFEAHATSKLKDIDDFDHLDSYGFRGEALCSIGAVGDVSVETSRKEASRGIRVRRSYGADHPSEPRDKRVGTLIEIRGLFARLPARLKFMKSARGEAQAISQVMRRYALAHPELSFSWGEKGAVKEERVFPVSSKKQRALWYFGSDDPHLWAELKSSEESSSWKFDLVALRPRAIGSVSSGIQLFLNGRPLKDVKIEMALRRAYEGFSLQPRALAAAVWIQADPALFDVNVHPTKQEVRWQKVDELFSLIVRCLRAEWESEHLAPDIHAPLERSRSEAPSATRPFSEPRAASESSVFSESRAVPTTSAASQRYPSSSQGPRSLSLFAESPVDVSAAAVPLFEAPVEKFSYLATLDSTYLLVKKSADLYIFDQHALHERILYERLLKNYHEGKAFDSQRILFPLSLLPEEVGGLSEREDLLARLGFDLRPWAEQKFQLVAAPAILKRGHREVLAQLRDSLERPEETLVRDILASLACHSAVRAHDSLQPAEVQQLLDDFSTQDALGHCPHGRPTYVKFEVKQLERLFQRLV